MSMFKMKNKSAAKADGPSPSLDMAYGMSKRKKLAKGGMLKDTVKHEDMPLPSVKADDSKMIKDNSAPKAKPKIAAMPEGRMASSSIIKVNKVDALGRKLNNDERHMIPDMHPEDETEHIQYDDEHALHSDKFAKGGSVEKSPSKQFESDSPKINHPQALKIYKDHGHSDEDYHANKHEFSDKSGVDSKKLTKHLGYAEGGEIPEEDKKAGLKMEYGHASENDDLDEPHGLEEDDDQERPAVDEFMASHFAEDGDVDEEDHIEHAASIASAIMARRRKMAEGGMADLNINADEEPNHEDDLSFEALKKENYDESSAIKRNDPKDSNEHGHSLDKDDHDMVSRIMKKMKSKSPIIR